MAEEKKKKKEINKNKIANLILIAGVFFAVGFFTSQQDFLNKEKRSYITMNEAKDRVEEFISENLVQPGTDLKVKGISEERGLYKVVVDLQGQEIDSYITKDGKSFFPQAMDIEEIEGQKEEAGEAEKAVKADVPKNDKPVIEAFIMSYCPYGTQVQKGLLPVIELLKNKIDFNFKFVNYAMHDKKEIDENLVQYCINEDSQDKYHNYLKCFLISDDSESCLATVGIDKNKLNQCVTETDSEYKVTEGYNDKEGWNGQFPPFNVQKDDNEKYGVQGSPTLIINGAQASSARDPQSLLATVCGAFEEAPAECEQELSSETPSPGFGEGTTASGAAGGCGE